VGRLALFVIPCPWREGGKTMSVEDKKEMLHNSFASQPVSRRLVWEELEKEILEELGGKMSCGLEDGFKED
jgi:hypothetical protein